MRIKLSSPIQKIVEIDEIGYYSNLIYFHFDKVLFEVYTRENTEQAVDELLKDGYADLSKYTVKTKNSLVMKQ